MSELQVFVYKAQPTIKTEPVPDLVLHAAAEVPESKSLELARNLYDQDGLQLAEALYKTLPGGTLDALLRCLLEKRASLFAVRFEP